MNYKEIIVTFVVFFIGYHALIHEHKNSLFYSILHGGDGLFEMASTITNDPIIQSAYENCFAKQQADFKQQNSHLPRDVYRMLKEQMPNICKDVIVASCKKGKDNFFCQSALKPYRS